MIELNFEYKNNFKRDWYKLRLLINKLLWVNLKRLKGMHHSGNFLEKKENYKSSIIVFAKKEKLKNLVIYDAINKILSKIKF